MVEMTRRWYQEVSFVIPHLAMSAGTIFCMSGDRIYMDYSSALGPIDPQVQSKDGRWVPALGYLDKFEEILRKAKNGELTDVEFALAQNQDLAVLRRYEQARDLSVNLLKDWLVRYKFKDWNTHRTNPTKMGQPVTDEEKTERAQEIADKLSNNGIWHSHGRMIGIETLKNELRLEVEDYTDNNPLRDVISSYHEMLVDYMQRQSWNLLIDARNAYNY